MKKRLFFLSFIISLFACSSDSTSTSTNSNEPASKTSTLKSGSTTGKLIDVEQGDHKYLHVQDDKSGQLYSFMLLKFYEGIETFSPENAATFKGKKIHVDWEETLIKIPEVGGKIKTVMVTGVTVLE